MIKAILIDDERGNLEELGELLERYCKEIAVIGSFESPGEGLLAIKNEQPDVVFLDIQMPGMSGFDLLKKASPVSFEVIFVTAYDRYAIKAIKFSALDYLLKPVDVDELLQAVDRVKERLGQKNNDYSVQSVLNNIQHNSGKIDCVAIPSSEGIDLFETKDIIFCQADGCYTKIILTKNQAKIVTKTLKEFENLLTDSGFCRVHNSYLVNLKHVKRYIRGEGGYVILTDDHHADISRRKKDEFLSLLNRL